MTRCRCEDQPSAGDEGELRTLNFAGKMGGRYGHLTVDIIHGKDPAQTHPRLIWCPQATESLTTLVARSETAKRCKESTYRRAFSSVFQLILVLRRYLDHPVGGGRVREVDDARCLMPPSVVAVLKNTRTFFLYSALDTESGPV